VKNIVYGLADGTVNPNLKFASLVQPTSCGPVDAGGRNLAAQLNKLAGRDSYLAPGK
jgi:hypothetical protein